MKQCAECGVDLIGASVRGSDGKLRHKICNAVVIIKERGMICKTCKKPVFFDKESYVKFSSLTDGTTFHHMDCWTHGREPRQLALSFPCTAMGEPVAELPAMLQRQAY